jgi:hypothetical protein
MRSDFVSSEQEEYSKGGLGSVVGSLYGWSVLGMLEKFGKTGEYYVPWTGKILRRASPFTTSMVGRAGRFGIPKAALGMDLGTASLGSFGIKKMAGIGRLGFAQMALSGGVKLGMSTMMWTDPVFFAFMNIGNPAMLLAGTAWFGGGALWKNSARAMERSRYVDMNQVFPETQASFTSRQRAVRAIAESHLQARAAVGNEAMLYHR